MLIIIINVDFILKTSGVMDYPAERTQSIIINLFLISVQ